jgi:predicted enzyme related to lactoylglutathione lyase
MAKAKNIGAVMIYANDPAVLSRWYARVFGIKTALNEKDGWYEGNIEGAGASGSIHFGIHSPESKLGASGHSIMINYEVDDFEEFLSHLEQHDIRVTRTLEEDYGRFAYFNDPEGNPIEIWARRAQ